MYRCCMLVLVAAVRIAHRLSCFSKPWKTLTVTMSVRYWTPWPGILTLCKSCRRPFLTYHNGQRVIHTALRTLWVQKCHTHVRNIYVLTYFPFFKNLQTPESLTEYTQQVSLHDPDCSYEAPNPCTASKPLSCCERLRQEELLSPSSSPSPDGAGTLVMSLSTMLMFLGTAIISIFWKCFGTRTWFYVLQVVVAIYWKVILTHLLWVIAMFIKCDSCL